MRRRKSKSQQPDSKTIKAVVLGKDGVGKSALTVRFLTKRFIGDYQRNAEMTYHHHLDIDGQLVLLNIMDTAGEYSREKIYRCAAFADIIFLLYSVTDYASFLEAQRIGKLIRQHRLQNDLWLQLVGTKKDLEHIREVIEEDGGKLAENLSAIFCEVSIAEGYDETQKLLLETLQQVLNKRRDEKQKGTGILKALGLARHRGVTL